MPNSFTTQAMLAYFEPNTLPPAVVQGRMVSSNLNDILAALQQDPSTVVIIYPLLSTQLLQNPQAIDAWQTFYQPLVALCLRGARGLQFVPLDTEQTEAPTNLVLKLASMLYPQAVELQDQLELNAHALQRTPVFAPINTTLQPQEVLELLTKVGHQPQESIYKTKADLLEAQLQLLQTEFVNTNDELEQLQTESMLTAELILKAGTRITKG